MRERLKRGLSVLLAFAMVFSLSMVSVSNVQAEEITDETDVEEVNISGSDETGQGESGQNDMTQGKTEESDQRVVEELDASDQEIDEPEDNADDEEQDASESVSAEYSLKMQYDDHDSLSDIAEKASVKEDLAEYPFIKIETTEVTSHQVSNGAVTDVEDEVVQYDEETEKLISTGIGSAVVTFSKTEIEETENTENTEDTENTEETNETTDDDTGDYVVLDVSVEPATLTMLFIAGQSNAEGTTSSGTDAQDSVACEEGTVYSTYAPSSESAASRNTGISGLGACTSGNAASFVADSLTGPTSQAGTELVYPLNALTEAGNGKTGMDSGLAYQWHNDTGDKVWVVNAGYSATSISRWVPGAECYERAIAVFQDAVKTADAEISAGHYTDDGHRLLFWQQGENDKTMSVTEYQDSFENIYKGFDNAGLGIEEYGIIMVRACTGSYTTSEDLAMTGPRTAQYLMGNSDSDSTVYVVSNVNEQWVSDSQVQDYFQGVYGGSLSYPTHSGASVLPTTVNDVHADIHYSQVGHNENGITAAQNMYHVVYGGQSSPDAIYWHDPDGYVLESGATINVEEGSSNIYVPVSDPLYLSKNIDVSVDGSDISYDEDTGVLQVSGSGNGTLTAQVGDVTSTVTISSDELETPVLKKATYVDGEITITWDPVDGASGYRVYRKPAGGSWGGIATTTDTNYTDDQLEANTTYYYTVRAFRGEEDRAFANTYSSAYWSDFESPGVSAATVYEISTPKLKKATASDGTITVTWNEVSDADGYRVYRKPSGGSWGGIASTNELTYTDSQVENGVTYYYTVRAYKGDQEKVLSNTYYVKYWSNFESPGVSATASTTLATPSLVKASASGGSVTISWKAVSGASGYRVYRKPSGGSWAGFATTEDLSYTDTGNLEIGTTYYYTVRAYKGDYETASQNTYMAAYWSGFESPGVSAKVTSVLSTPSLVSAKNSEGANTITWKAVDGADGYRVYRKPSGGSWAGFATTNELSYTDMDKLEIGSTYYYTVRAFKGDWETASANTYDAHYWSDFESPGVSVKTLSALSTPSLVSAKNSEGANIITWKAVDGADGYRVYRKPSGGSWAGFATTNELSYTDTDYLDIGTTYYYTVRAFKGDWETASENTYDSHYWSDFESPGVSVKVQAALSTPSLVSAKNSDGANIITWKAVSGATGYRVYRKPSGGSWAGFATTDELSYTDMDKLEIGTTYYYTVRAFKGDWETASANTYDAHYWSDFESPGVSVKTLGALSTPSLVSAKTSEGSNIITWKAVSGAGGYRIYRKPSGGSWAGFATTTDLSYTDTDYLDIGTTYYYTVRAFKGDWETASDNAYDSHYWSDFESPGVSVKTLSALSTPTLVSASSSKGSNTITWKSVSGAGGYRIYRKPSGGSWAGFDTTDGTSYTDTSNLDIGTTYYYTVRAFKGDWESASECTYDSHYWSDFESPGVSVKQTAELATPALSKATASTAQNTITWSAVDQADGYRVYRKPSGGSWNTIGITEDLSYTDSTDLDAGATYYYTVRAYKGDYDTAAANTYTSHYWSDFESPGVSATAISVLSTPTLKSATKISSGVSVTFNSVSGAGGYRVYRKPSGGSWAGIGNTTSTSYTDTSTLSSSTTYYYTVRAYKGDYSTASAHMYDVNYWSAFDTTGLKYVSVADVDMYNKAQSYSSSTKYLILVNCTTNKVGIFTGSKNNWDMKYYWSCSTGKSSTPTKKGTFTIGSKGKSFGGSSYTCWYYSQFSGNYLFHSVLYKKGSMTTISDGRLGMNISHGCVRLDIDNAKWIYDNVSKGSTVVTY